ncbi:MAG: hypothetical protein U5R06_00335 [candidate division KSB1 bacterium]|nr:hypothetical protein [candidate division KSB1 bacterium]
MIRGIIIAHGHIGEAFIDAVNSIVGECVELYSLSVSDMSAADIRDRLLALVNAPLTEKKGIVIMACLKGGSSWNVAASIAAENDRVRVLSGVNLSMVLAFLTKRKTMELDELTAEIRKRGQTGVDMLKSGL